MSTESLAELHIFAKVSQMMFGVPIQMNNVSQGVQSHEAYPAISVKIVCLVFVHPCTTCSALSASVLRRSVLARKFCLPTSFQGLLCMEAFEPISLKGFEQTINKARSVETHTLKDDYDTIMFSFQPLSNFSIF